jgi:hypothetical protein
VSGSAGVLAIVFAQTVAGGSVLLWATPLWHEVKRGFFTLTGAILAVLSFATWFSAASAVQEGDAAGVWVVRLAAVTAVLTTVSLVFLAARRWVPGRVIGSLGTVAAVATLVPIAATARQGAPLAAFQLFAGAWFLGAVLDGLLLGHWYLTDRGLSRTPIDRFTNLLIGGVVVEAIAVISGGFAGVGESPDFNPLLTAGALAPWIALGMVAVTALIAGFVHATLRGTRASAVQAATGFFYLAVVTAFTAEVAVKTRFLPR